LFNVKGNGDAIQVLTGSIFVCQTVHLCGAKPRPGRVL
jgi:hypothetical protein